MTDFNAKTALVYDEQHSRYNTDLCLVVVQGGRPWVWGLQLDQEAFDKLYRILGEPAGARYTLRVTHACPVPASEVPGIAQDLFEAQRQLNRRILGFDLCLIQDVDQRYRWFRNFLTAWEQELKEYFASVDVNAQCTNVPEDAACNLQVEAVDLLHFLLSLFQVVGERGIDPTRVGFPVSAATFEGLFAKQNKALGLMPRTLAHVRAADVIRQGLYALKVTGQLLDAVQWKWWAKQTTNWDQVRELLYKELLPAWVRLALVAGLDADGAAALYMKKNQLNHERQDGGYKEGRYQKEDAAGTEDNARLFQK